MVASKKQVKDWYRWGKRSGKYSHLIIMRDVFQGFEYPFFLKTGSDHREEIWAGALAIYPFVRGFAPK